MTINSALMRNILNAADGGTTASSIKIELNTNICDKLYLRVHDLLVPCDPETGMFR